MSLQVVQDEWASWKVQYEKSYSSVDEERRRMMIFLDHKQLIARHNERYYKGEVTYKMGLNQFSDMVLDNEFFLLNF